MIGEVIGAYSAYQAGGDILLGVVVGGAVGAAAGYAGGFVPVPGAKAGFAAQFGAGFAKGAIEGAAYGAVGGFAGGQGSVESILQGAAIGAVVAGTLRGVYHGVAGFDATLNPGGEALEKARGQMPVAGSNHVGLSVRHGEAICALCEGSRLSRILNRIPGVNGTAGIHDALMAKVDLVLTPQSLGWHAVSVGTMAPSAGVTYGSVIGPPAWHELPQ